MSRARRQLEADLRDLLKEPDDLVLRKQLEALGSELPLFPGFTWLWGPALYQRNRVLFRPFILNHFSGVLVEKVRGPAEPVAWSGRVATALEAWLLVVDADGDIPLFRRLIQWKVAGLGWSGRSKALRRELLGRFRLATSEHGRLGVLRRFDFPFDLDEATALELYRIEPLATDFILRHLGWGWSWMGKASTGIWRTVVELARTRGDAAFEWKLYRAQVSAAEWQSDALADCGRIGDPRALLESLERRHPRGGRGKLGEGFLQLLEARGEAVLPYVVRHLEEVWWNAGKDAAGSKLVLLARRQGWREFWGRAARVCLSPKEFNAEVRRELEDGSVPVDQQRHHLALLAGVSREWNHGPIGLARVHPLNATVALLLHRRHPDLLRGPFRVHVQVPMGREDHDGLLEALIAGGEDELVDFLASRYVTVILAATGSGPATKEVARLSALYEGMLTDEARFAWRAARVLGHVPAYGIHHYPTLVRTNRLARLLFERTPALFLACPRGVADLVEGSDIHVMALAYRILGLADARAVALARVHVDLLLGTLLRPLHRQTRCLAFRALANAATDEELAPRILARAREAFALPDDQYPKDALAQLVGGILDRHAGLRRASEHPRIHRAVVEGVA